MGNLEGTTFRKDFGLRWPDYDRVPERCHYLVTRNSKDMDLTASFCKQHRLCVQAGGHAGVFPMRLARHFDKVLTFEPDPFLFSCLYENTLGNLKILPYQSALGNGTQPLKMSRHSNAGGWQINPLGDVEVQQTRIDALNLEYCDAIILDIEAYEPEALKGAINTIERFSPVLHVEELPRAAKGIAKFMKIVGYTRRRVIHGDGIYTRGK